MDQSSCPPLPIFSQSLFSLLHLLVQRYSERSLFKTRLIIKPLCRAGGATDLFNMNVPYLYIKLWGRWKSDAALTYYRDRVAAKLSIANAFASLASSLL